MSGMSIGLSPRRPPSSSARAPPPFRDGRSGGACRRRPRAGGPGGRPAGRWRPRPPRWPPGSRPESGNEPPPAAPRLNPPRPRRREPVSLSSRRRAGPHPPEESHDRHTVAGPEDRSRRRPAEDSCPGTRRHVRSGAGLDVDLETVPEVETHQGEVGGDGQAAQAAQGSRGTPLLRRPSAPAPAPAEPHRQRRRAPRRPRPVPDAALERLAVATTPGTVHRVDRPVPSGWSSSSGIPPVDSTRWAPLHSVDSAESASANLK